jgi:DNA polymerase V
MSLQLYFPKPSDTLYPFFTIPISAGTAQDIEQIVEWINLDQYVRRGGESTYYLRVYGDSMNDVGIFDGDLFVVERREFAENGDIVIAEINGEFTVKEYKREQNKLYLVPANGKYKTRQIKPKDEFNVWGVVTYIVHKPRKKN